MSGRGRMGHTPSPVHASGTHLHQQQGLAPEINNHLLLRGLPVYQGLHEPRSWEGGKSSVLLGTAPPPPSMFFVMPHHCPQHLPQPLTFLMQVPEGQKSLYHIRQTADHRVPALQHLMDLVYLEQGVESKKGGCRGIP